MIRAAFENAWLAAQGLYERGAVPSEATLQAALFCEIARALPSLEVFCEVQLCGEDLEVCCPDLLVIDGPLIVAVAELKFAPESNPRFKGDIEKLQSLARAKSSFRVRLDPRSGQYCDPPVRISEETLFVFGVIGRAKAPALDKQAISQSVSAACAEFLFLSHVSRQ